MELLFANFPTLHHLFERSAIRFENAVAVVYNGQSITYRELNSRADQLAQALLLYAKEEEIIGISTTRSLEMIIGLMAILKSGKAYLPMDPNFPESRLEQMITNSRVKICTALSSEKDFFEKLTLQVIPSDTSYEISGEAVVRQNPNACVLYTSGSTGKPKGVCVPHQGLVNFLLWQKEHSKAAPHLKTLQFCHLGFDVSIEEIFVPLITGGTLYLINDTYRLDSGNLLHFIEKEAVNRMYLPYVELQYFAEEAIRENLFPSSLVEVITGGELLKITPQIRSFFNSLNNCPLMNKYGPTEACIWVTELKLSGDASTWPEVPTIGKPFANTEILILNDQLELVPDGELGEMCTLGICTANGYLNEPEITAKSFITWTDKDNNSHRIYKTGDLGRYLPDGNIEFHGRRDGQVKIRGNRVELADIEVALTQQEGIQQAVVIAREDIPGKKYLAAYLVSRNEPIDIKKLRSSLLALLPDYMIPSYFIQLEDLPKTPSGKVDRKVLPKPTNERPELGVLYKRPTTEIEKNIAGLLINILQYDKIGIDDNFFELGGNSLLAQKTISELKHQFKYRLPITKLYQFPTISGIAKYLQDSDLTAKALQIETSNKETVGNQNQDIAVIAMSGRFPGANTIEELWEVLKEGRETIKFFTEEELDPLVPLSLKNDPMYVRARGIVEQADQFDAGFFGVNPKLAELMDPQQRIFMEISWEALENAGYFPQNGHSNIGVFAGSYNNTYYLNNVQHNKKLMDQVGEFQVMSANEKDYIASRTAYHLNLRGPAVSVYSACSTSLLAIVQAVESIRKGQCEMALAGGASINSPINSGHLYQEGAMLSANGHCSPFDAASSGTLFSDGAGVVLLKNLEKAKEDGDTIFAVIKGVGLNNDGGDKGSFTAPSAEGQAGAIHMAIKDARIAPASIGYLEAHGTGTPLGDPIEIEGLSLAFGPQNKKQYCAIGSIKSNIGHLTAAAGVAGFIKTALSLHHKQIIPSLGFNKPNPNIDFENSPFYVNQSLREWESEDIRRAGVSSFGVGGTNVHVLLEEFDAEKETVDQGRHMQVITWSAKSVNSLDSYGNKLLDLCQKQPDIELADIAYTLQNTRASFNYRRYLVASSIEDFKVKLAKTKSATNSNSLTEMPGEIVFSFPGQGAQYLNMGYGLYLEEKVYKNAVDACAEILKAFLGTDIRKIIYPTNLDQEAEDKIKNTRYTQPALFVTEYALAQLWMSWGINPTILCGHSIGEFVAAHLAGIFSLEDALKLVSARGLMISGLPKGSMLSVRSRIDMVEKLLPPELSLAAINTKDACVVSGPDEYIATFAQKLDQNDIPNRILLTSHAFHSSMMDPIIEDFQKVIESVTLKNPVKPLISTATGTWLKDDQATDPSYWAKHLRMTVKFSDALDTIALLENPLFIEVGPGNVTSTLAKQQIGDKTAAVVSSIERVENQSDINGMLNAVGSVWINGLEPNWKAFYGSQKRKKLILPNYAFDKKRYWVDPPALVEQSYQEDVAFSMGTTVTKTPSQKQRTSTRAENLQNKIKEILEASGINMPDTSMSFLELGLDSLLLTQVALTLKKEFNLPITFRQLNEVYSTPAHLIRYLDDNLPHGEHQEAAPLMAETTHPPVQSADLYAAMELINQQLQHLSSQMQYIQNELVNRHPVVGKVNTSLQAPKVTQEVLQKGTKPLKKENGHMDLPEEKGQTVIEEISDGDNGNNYFLVPPVPGAKLGKDQSGNPAWYIEDPDQKGNYLQIII